MATDSIVLNINDLRKGVKQVTPALRDSYKGSGMACFTWAEDALWVVAGSFQKKICGAVVYNGERMEEVEDVFFDIYSLNLFLKTSFSLSTVKVTCSNNRLRFQVGRSYKEIALTGKDTGFSEYLSLPAVGHGISANDFLAWGSVAEFAHPNEYHSLHSVHLIVQDGWGHLLATSGFSAGYVWFESDDKTLDFRATLPSDFLKIGQGLDWDTEPKLVTGETRCYLRSKSCFLTGTTVNYDYPAEQVMALVRDYGDYPAVQVPVAELIGALATFADASRDRGVVSVNVAYEEETEGLIFSASEEAVAGEMYVPATKGHLQLKAKVNGMAIKTAAEMLKTAEVMFINIQNHNNGWLIIRPDNNAAFCLGTMAF